MIYLGWQGQRKASELLNIGYFAQHQMDSLDESASQCTAIGTIADKNQLKRPTCLFRRFRFSGERMNYLRKVSLVVKDVRVWHLALIVWLRLMS